MGADLANMQLLSKFHKGIPFLFCVIDIFSKYIWVIPLKDKNGITITNAFLLQLLMVQNLKLVIMLEYRDIKIFLQKDMFQIGLKKFF